MTDNQLCKDLCQTLENIFKVEYRDDYVEVIGEKGIVKIYPKKVTIIVELYLYNHEGNLYKKYGRQGFRLHDSAVEYIITKLK